MRLKSEQISSIHQILKNFFKEIKYELFLYGSRTQDELKGGDIDLLIVTDTEGLELFTRNHLDILVQIKKQPSVGQRRIDFKAVTVAQLKTDPFLISIKESMLQL